MKAFLHIFLFLFCLSSLGQNNKPTKLSKEKIASAKIIHDLISDIPKGCVINSWKFSAAVNGSFKEWTVNGPSLTAEVKAVIQSLGKKGSFSIESISSGCGKNLRNKYSFVPE